MKKIYFQDQQLCDLPTHRVELLKLLLPYWGLKIDGEVIFGTLEARTYALEGLSDPLTKRLDALLAHTGLQRVPGVRPRISAALDSQAAAPIAVYTPEKTFYLKPLRKETTDVQTWIHKRIWLPEKTETIRVVCHRREKPLVAEWLAYLLLQHFLQQTFQPLSTISYETYTNFVQRVLSPINPVLAEAQQTLQQPEHGDWPELPKKNQNKEENQVFQPFKSSSSSQASPIQPFTRRNTGSSRKKIDPFRKK